MSVQKKWTALVVAAPLLLAGCGEDSDDTTTETRTQDDPPAQTQQEDGEQQEQVLELTNVPGEPRFDKTTLQASAGEVTLRLTVQGETEHNIAIEDAEGEDVGEEGDLVADGEVSETTVELEPGTYTYYCAPHKDAGMVGTLTVT